MGDILYNIADVLTRIITSGWFWLTLGAVALLIVLVSAYRRPTQRFPRLFTINQRSPNGPTVWVRQ